MRHNAVTMTDLPTEDAVPTTISTGAAAFPAPEVPGSCVTMRPRSSTVAQPSNARGEARRRRAGSVRSGRAVAVVGPHLEALPQQEATRLHLDARGPVRQDRRHKEFDVALLYSGVAREVFLLEVGVDRHLDDPASPNRWDEVERRHTATRTHEGDRLVAQLDLEVPRHSAIVDRVTRSVA